MNVQTKIATAIEKKRRATRPAQITRRRSSPARAISRSSSDGRSEIIQKAPKIQMSGLAWSSKDGTSRARSARIALRHCLECDDSSQIWLKCVAPRTLEEGTGKVVDRSGLWSVAASPVTVAAPGAVRAGRVNIRSTFSSVPLDPDIHTIFAASQAIFAHVVAPNREDKPNGHENEPKHIHGHHIAHAIASCFVEGNQTRNRLKRCFWGQCCDPCASYQPIDSVNYHV